MKAKNKKPKTALLGLQRIVSLPGYLSFILGWLMTLGALSLVIFTNFYHLKSVPIPNQPDQTTTAANGFYYFLAGLILLAMLILLIYVFRRYLIWCSQIIDWLSLNFKISVWVVKYLGTSAGILIGALVINSFPIQPLSPTEHKAIWIICLIWLAVAILSFMFEQLVSKASGIKKSW